MGNDLREPLNDNLVLIGFMGTGKSTISAYLSEKYHMETIDMDQVIVEEEGMSIPHIFERYGETYFRNLETSLLKRLQTKKHVVISCGGGTALREENVKEMKKNGRVILLTAAPATIYERVKDSDERPILHGNKNIEYISSLMAERAEKYETAADVIVETDHKTAAEICEEIITRVMELK